MINKLHMAMIELYHGDAKRTQHFCKVHSYAKLIAEMENVDVKKNTETVTENYRKKKARSLLKSCCQILVFPEKFLSGYSI